MPQTTLPDRHPHVIRPEEEKRVLAGIRMGIGRYNTGKSKEYACAGCGLVQEAELLSIYKNKEGEWVVDSPKVDTTGWSHTTMYPKDGHPRIERHCPPCIEKRDAAVRPQPENK